MTSKFIGIFFLFSALAQGRVESPKDCLSNEIEVCHFGTVMKTSHLGLGNIQIYMGQEALLKREQGKIEWVQGPVLFEVAARSTIYIKKHSVELQRGKYIIFDDDSVVKAEVLDGHFQIGPFQITEGFLATFKWNQGEPSLEPLQAIDFKDHLVRYVKLKNLNKQQAQEYAEEFGPKVKNYVVWLQELNQNLIKRSVAQEEKERKIAFQIRERNRLAQEKRKLEYFNKVFER